MSHPVIETQSSSVVQPTVTAPPQTGRSLVVRTAYPFEVVAFRREEKAKYGQTETPVGRYLKIFTANLGIDFNQLVISDKRLVNRFVEVLHMNAAWYEKYAKREIWYIAVFVVITGLLTLALPALVWAISTLPEGGGGSTITAQLTVMLSGVFGIHRFVQKWLSSRKLHGARWTVRTQLVDIIYNLETSFADKALTQDGALDHRLCEQLSLGIEKAREIIRDEIALYYQNLTVPEDKLTDLAKQGLTDATGYLKALPLPGAANTDARKNLNNEILEKKADIEKANTWITLNEERLQKLRNNLDDTTDEPEQKKLKEDIIASEKALDVKRSDIIDFKAAIAGLEFKLKEVRSI